MVEIIDKQLQNYRRKHGVEFTNSSRQGAPRYEHPLNETVFESQRKEYVNKNRAACLHLTKQQTRHRNLRGYKTRQMNSFTIRPNLPAGQNVKSNTSCIHFFRKSALLDRNKSWKNHPRLVSILSIPPRLKRAETLV